MKAAYPALLSRVIARESLSESEMTEVIAAMMSGEFTPSQIAGLLVALRVKEETPAEIAGAARAMRAKMVRLETSVAPVCDTCGTGGDGANTVNISTIAAIVVAATAKQAAVAKHGNRAQSSRCGSADLLEALGIAIDVEPSVAQQCLTRFKFAFLFAPHYHAATRAAATPRRELGVRTLFNLLGPLTNPAGASRQLIGVPEQKFCAPLAHALAALGSEHVWVVHGENGVDEIAVAGETHVAEWWSPAAGGPGEVREFAISPGDFGISDSDPNQLLGGVPAENAAIARAVFAGEMGAVRSASTMAASAMLFLAGEVSDLPSGVALASAAIDSGRVTALVDQLALHHQPVSHHKNGGL